MNDGSRRVVAALGSGVLFGVGLVLSGMTQPAKVRAFLDLFGAWDPSLAFVMAGAIGVHAVGLRVLARRPAPAAAEGVPAGRARVGGRLLFGAAIFGVGWGMSGYCPGPALVALPGAGASGVVFVASLALGNIGGSALKSLRFRRVRSAALQS